MKRKTLILITLFVFTLQYVKGQNVKNIEKSPALFNPETNCVLRYYYYPNLEAYFDTERSIYFYKENGKWVTADEIPSGYRGYSIYNKSNVFITDYDDGNPCQFIDIHKKKYPYVTKGKINNATALND